MHNPNISQRRRQIMLLLSYIIMTAAVLVISIICLLLILGYRFDAASNRFEQGGLIQFRTTPSSATITFDDRRLNFTTPGKLNVAAGEHTVEYSKKGYLSWRKTVNISAGELRWLNYARLIPEEIVTEAVLDVESFDSSLVSPDRGFIAVLEDKNSPNITIIDIRNEREVRQHTVVPQKDAVTTAKASYRLIEWDANSRYMLLEQSVGGKKQFLRVDRVDSAEPAINISDAVRLNISRADFYKGSNSQLLVQTADIIRLVNLANKTISGPLVTDVVDYSLVSNDEVAFLAERDDRRVVGVYVGDKEIVVRTFDETGKVAVGMGTYYDERYLAVSHQNKLELIISPESKEGSAGRNFVELELPFAPERVAFSPTGRFVVATNGLNIYVYDLELEGESSFKFPGEPRSTGESIGWIDGYYLASTQNGEVVISEFDGHNRHEIISAVKGSQPTFDESGDYLYSFTANNGKYQLQRSRLVVD